MLITQSYADATRLRGMLPHVEDDCCYTEMNPTSAIQKLEQIRPDVLILSILGNTDLVRSFGFGLNWQTSWLKCIWRNC